MQYRPTAGELLTAIADVIEHELLPALPSALQHKARVAGNVVRILEREERLAAGAADRERTLLAGVLGHDGDVGSLAAELAERLRHNDDPGFEDEAWAALVEVARDDLAIAKPGHDSWEGR